MIHLRDNPKQGYIPVYIDVESCELPTSKLMGFLLQREANWRNQ
jgi:hypothetical protein